MSRDWDEMVAVGRIARTHGNRGHVVVNPETDFATSRFQVHAVLYSRTGDRMEPLTINAVRFHDGRPIIGICGVETMSDAEQLAGVELRVPAAALVQLPPGVFYRHDLVGCAVTTVGGTSVGTVSRVEGSWGESRLVVRGAADEILVPLAATICVRVDPAARVIVIDPPEGLLDLNAAR